MLESNDHPENELDDLLVGTCKNVIRTILTCLEHATKGTIYRIGPLPELRAVRITSGIRGYESEDISWGLPFSSDYNHPGKSFDEYKDRPGHVMEAMGWCVEKQRSWTADNPFEDVRSVGKQLRGEIEDYHHMEPVLVRKQDLYGGCPRMEEYPRDWQGQPIWQDTAYAVCAVIKIHFKPESFKRGDRSTRVIREISSGLGTELLSLHFRETLLRAQKELARERLQTCEILAHEIRNAVMKFGFILPAINAQLEMVRDEWERYLRGLFPEVEWRQGIIERLREELLRIADAHIRGSGARETMNELDAELSELTFRSFLPPQGEQWIQNRIVAKMNLILSVEGVPEASRRTIGELLARLLESLRLPADGAWPAKVTSLPRQLAEQWSDLAYSQVTSQSIDRVEELLGLLDRFEVPIRQRRQIRRTLLAMNVLAKVFPDIEERTNRIIESLKTGGSEVLDSGGSHECSGGPRSDPDFERGSSGVES